MLTTVYNRVRTVKERVEMSIEQEGFACETGRFRANRQFPMITCRASHPFFSKEACTPADYY